MWIYTGLEHAFLTEDLRVQLLQRAARLDPQVVDEEPAPLVVGRERVGLPARAVEREHELRPQPLAEWIRAQERFELRQDLAVAFQLELRVEQLLGRCEPQLLEPARLVLCERLELRVRERRPAPERERLAQEPRPLRRECVARGPHEPLEAEEKTDEELDSLTRDLMKQGLTAQQAHDQAWEMVRERYIFLPPEDQQS